MTQIQEQPSTSLHGKTALVTGGSRSVGRDIALRLAQAGADVIVTYRAEAAAAAAVVEQIRAMDRRAQALAVDLKGTAEIAGLVERVTGVLAGWGTGGLDILIHNAGMALHQPIASVSEDAFDAVVDLNFKSVVFLTQALLPSLNDGGRIIAIGSGLSRFSMPGFSVYGPLKAALERFMAYLAVELAERGITANAVSPGALDTDFNAAALAHNPQMRAHISSITALGRMGVAEDVGGVVAMLCSPAARWITGERIEVSGGMRL
ncbi:SDR family NAD(P)-dependent oxidoreductase [Haliangium ochraceum]|uniref:Short-chain dehydrogenase/reductase SDR n=1 Tax=Haliangium ochraceum (strain DSM 14365 / JCM 11303 / SMP-2) TaxID=502025 RepID=D0LIE8_HALO1|nr:SDR family oxidoreductase [Haliangium ochraceum]ACY18304.1 short-chain dehydrogenase/reductase SDR [Haliangium ochraceum DSM 14365]